MAEKPLLDFDEPPVVEVALGVQFRDLPGLRAHQMIMLWHQVFRDELPEVQELAPVEVPEESFGAVSGPRLAVRVQLGLPPQRFGFVSADGSELVQIQCNRFVRNWCRYQAPADYPRYPPLKKKFMASYVLFEKYLAAQGLGELVPVQCEVTYVNEIRPGRGWSDHSDLDKVLSVCGKPNGEFLPATENAEMTFRYVVRQGEDPVGRLHVSVGPRIRTQDGSPVYVLQLTARGTPLGDGQEGVCRFLDLGREWVVRGFADVTTAGMHEAWGRKC